MRISDGVQTCALPISASFALKPDRRYWLHLAQGAAEVDGRALSAGDAIGYVDESGELLVEGVAGNAVADVLLFDLPAWRVPGPPGPGCIGLGNCWPSPPDRTTAVRGRHGSGRVVDGGH